MEGVFEGHEEKWGGGAQRKTVLRKRDKESVKGREIRERESMKKRKNGRFSQ